MQPTPTQTQTEHHKAILNELVDMAADIARAIHKQATKPGAQTPAEDPIIPFDRIARTIRKTIALAQYLDKPQRPQQDRTTARRKIIRRIEDNIHISEKSPRAEALDREFRERLDASEFDHELATRPIEDIIDEIIHDLGLDPRAGLFKWKRRTPEDVKILNQKAATPSPSPPGQGYRIWPSRVRR